MTLRIMLVGLVASLGFELPSGPDVSSWAQASRAWVEAALLDRSGPEGEPTLDLAVPSDCQQVDEKFEVPALASEMPGATDAAFEAVSGAIAADLSADLLASRPEAVPGESIGALAATEPPSPVGLPEGEEVGCLIVAAEAGDAKANPAEVATIEEYRPAEPAESTTDSSERLDRVSAAVRLTREALNAWADVMQQPVDEAQPSR